MPDASAPASILIVRLSAIGDVVMASALIPALREAYPDARLAWLTDEANAGLLRHNPRLDRLFLWPRARWRQLRREGQLRRYLQEMTGLVRSLRRERFDWVLDTQGLLKSGLWARLAGGKRRVGLGSREGSQWLMTETLDRHGGERRIGSEYLKLARFLGAEPTHFPMDIVPSADEAARAAEVLAQAGVAGAYAVLCPFTTRPQKHWFKEHWAELAPRLQRELGLAAMMLGGPGDDEEARQIQALCPGIVSLAGQTGLGEAAAVIAGASLLIGVDTGLTHLGIAMDTPTLTLFGSTRPYLDTGSATARVLYHAMECSPCRRRPTCGGEFTCMRRHTADTVMAAARELMQTIGKEMTAHAS
ncbi:glycosyltransferase family 9 protein [Methyloterricola oryzae]|uniref:glycosyltransferase family 9 protein n=1 Tax=Methyloterricola oryzae TaxID=1495050 RepID=UPI0005EB0E15|nr:glycosyltransferase family 9 protein [Methyloterricola oryzae]